MAIGRPISLTPNIATKNISSLATADQTEFTVTGGYRINEIAVYRNGVRLAQGRDFTASDGSTVDLVTAATVDDVIEFQVFDSFNVSSAIVSAASSQTLSGDLNVTGNLYAGAFNPTSIVAAAATITRITNTDIVGTGATFNSTFHVGSALTANASGDVDTIGIITASNLFVGTGVTVYGSTGIVSATTFYGDGSNLSNITSTTINNNADNRLISGSGTANTLNGESNLTFDGSTLAVTGDLTASDSIAVTKDINVGAAATITGALSGSTGTFSGAVNVDATTDSTSSTSGALIVDGGLGVAKNVYIGAGLSVAGTLTYEDVTSVDSVGLITAKSGVNITGGQLTVGSGITMGIAGVATFSGTSDVHLLDNVKLNVGDGSDLSIYHNATNSYIDNSTGHLYLRSNTGIDLTNAAGSKTMIEGTNAGEVSLYYNNSKKFETTNDGTSTTGIATATVGIDAAISVWTLGASGTDHYTFTGPGNLSATTDPTLNLKRGQKYTFKNRSGGHPFRIQSTPNGSAGTAYNTGVTNNDGGDGTNIIFDVPHNAPNVLYYQCTSHGNMGGAMYIDGSAYEISIGAGITFGSAGVSTFSGTADVHLTDNVYLKLGDSNDFSVYHDGSGSYLQANSGGAGNLYLDANGDRGIYIRSGDGSSSVHQAVSCISNAEVQLYYDNSKKFETTNDGTVTTGIGTFTSHVRLPDNAALCLGNRISGTTLGDLRLYHNGSHSYIDEIGTGNLYIRNNTDNAIFCQTDAGVHVYYDNSEKIKTTNDGVVITGICTDSLGNVRSIPANSQTGSYTMVASDAGKVIYTNSGVTVPANVFKQGHAISIVNYSSSAITITQGSSLTLRTGSDTGNKDLDAYSMATVWFGFDTLAFMSGSLS